MTSVILAPTTAPLPVLGPDNRAPRPDKCAPSCHISNNMMTKGAQLSDSRANSNSVLECANTMHGVVR